MKNPAFVDTYPTIAQKAAQHGNTLAYRIWLLARHSDHDGNGSVKLSDLHATMTLAGLNLSHYRIARATPGWAIFFKLDNNSKSHLKYNSDVVVRNHYGCASERLVGELSLRKDFKSMHRFNAFNYAAWIKNRPNGKQTISRDRLTDLWNASVTTLLRWEKLLGLVIKQANFGTVTEEKLDKVAHMMPRNADGDFPAVENKNGALTFQLPNTYVSICPTRKRVSRGRKGGQNRGAAPANRKKRFVEPDKSDRSWQLLPDKNGQFIRVSGDFFWTPELARVVSRVDALA